MWYFVAFLVGFILSGACYGSNLLLQKVLVKRKLYKLQGLSMVIVSIIPAIIICICFSTYPFNFRAILDCKMWLIAICTVLVTSMLIKLKHEKYEAETGFILCVEAVGMEIPQRVMMQTLVCGLLASHEMQAVYGIIINALIWCFAIVIQACIMKDNRWKHLIIELISSFVFSLGIGFVFYASECFVIPMLAHAAERIVTRKQFIK